jgi:hypothetical protein
MMIKQISKIVAAIAILAVARPAQAQWTFNPNLAPSLLWPVVNNPCPNGDCSESKKPSKNSPSTPAKLSSSKLVFKPSNAVRQASLKRFVENLRQNNPAGAVQVKQIFDSTDVINQIGQKMATVGLKSNNLADAYAVYWTSAWLGARGRSDSLPKTQMIAVRNQVAEVLLKVPQLAAATDTQKQEIAETLLVQALLISISTDGSKSDPAVSEQVQKVIAQGAKSFGLDLYQMTLTDQGFRSVTK